MKNQSVIKFLSQLRKLNIQVSAEGSKLRCKAPDGVITPALSQQIAERKAEILLFLQQVQQAARTSVPEFTVISRDRNLPLSFAQERLWFLNQLEGSKAPYIEQGALRITGKLNIVALQQALAEIVRRHEVFRTHFHSANGTLVQVIDPKVSFEMVVLDWQHLKAGERETQVQQFAHKEAQTPFDLSQVPLLRATLLRIQPLECVFLLTMHHIVADGWSVEIFSQELSVLYQAYSEGKSCPLPDLSVQYADFAFWQRQWLTGEVQHQQLQYWKQQLAGAPSLLQLPSDRPRPPVQTYRGHTQTFALDKHLMQQLQKLSEDSGSTLFMTLLAAFAVLLFRYSGQEDILIGSPIANRNRPEIESLIGFFANTLVLRTRLQGNPSFAQLLKQVREMTLKAYEHQDVPFEQVVEALQPERSLSYSPLFQVMLVLQNSPMKPLELAGVTLTPLLHIEPETAKFDLLLSIEKTETGLVGSWEYSTDLFEARTISQMASHFQTLLAAITANPNQTIEHLPLLSQAERQLLLSQENNAFIELKTNKCIHQLFEEQVERTPNAVAVMLGNQQFTYRQLNERANQLADYLQALGVEPEVLVGVCVERSLEMVVGLLGILKAGGAYVPLDPTYPSTRLAFMLSDSQVSVLLTQEKLVEKLPGNQASVVVLDSDWEAIAQYSQSNCVTSVTPNNLAYVIYTSGSTGQPKGVALTHKSATNFLNSMQQKPGLTTSDILLAVTTISFDIAVLEIYLPLVVGAKVVIVSREVTTDGKRLLTQLVESDATVMQATPATWHLLLASGWETASQIKVLCGGEALTTELANQLRIRSTSLWNLYGPTETTVWSSVYHLDAVPSHTHSQDTYLPIGTPIANTQIYILDAQMQPVPAGVVGELYISGDGLSRGYFNCPETTAEKFLPNPWSSQPGARLYKTGDRARYNSDGNIEFLGRIDHQVKLRGYRIELGEIESLLNQHPQVQQAVAMIREDTPGQERIVAYCTQDLSNALDTTIESTTQLPTEHVSQWQTLYDQTYAQSSQESDPTFNTVGWNSSYTNQPIPSEQMRQWLDGRVNHLLAFQPRRVLEIGCGTGLLLFQIAPHCEHYYGTDFSDVALASIAQQLLHPEWHLPQVQLQQKLANDFTDVPDASFDTVILNSVVQYFPSIHYLLQVLEKSVKAVAPGGIVFIGDVRSLPLLEAMYASVQLYQAEDQLSILGLRQRLQAQMAQEKELVIDPEFFLALKQHLPQINSVQIRLQQAEYHNELTSFRYDVTIEVGSGQSKPEWELIWYDWQKEGLTLENTAKLLEPKPLQLGIVKIPNTRVLKAIKTVELLSGDKGLSSITQVRTAINSLTLEQGVEPEQLRSIAQVHGYTLAISWSETDLGCYDVVFLQQSTHIAHKPVGGVTPLERKKVQSRAWHYYANNPLNSQQRRQLQSQLLSFVSARLPEYMVPSAFVMLDSLPLTSNGKVDRKALPAPEKRVELSNSFVAPKTPMEKKLANIWASVLGIESVGIHDNFFALGGNSLRATQLVSRLQQIFNLEVPVRTVFESPTVAKLSDRLTIREDNSLSLIQKLQAVPSTQLNNRERIEL